MIRPHASRGMRGGEGSRAHDEQDSQNCQQMSTPDRESMIAEEESGPSTS